MALACHGGEDYSVLLAVPESCSLPQGRPIGNCVAKRSQEARLWLRRDDMDMELRPQGYEHFAEQRRT